MKNNHSKPKLTENRLFIFRMQNGFTVTELLAAVAVSTVLIALAAVAIFTFFTKYRELSLFAELQQEAFDTVETLKYGYAFDSEFDYVFLGIANSREVKLELFSGDYGAHTGIICYPEESETGTIHDYIRYYFDRNEKVIRVQSLQGVRFYQDRVFPKDANSNIEVTAFKLSSLTGSEDVRVVEMEIEARVMLEEEKYRYVSYKTNIALGR